MAVYRTRALEQAKKEEASTKAKILNAAEDLFAVLGLRGTTTREIAEAAGVNIALIHYHWGTKQELWNAVHADILDMGAKFAAQLREKFPRIDNVKELRDFLTIVFDFMADHPNYPKIWVQPGQEGSDRIWAAERREFFDTNFVAHFLNNSSIDFSPADPSIAMYLMSGMVRVIFYRPDQAEIYFGEDINNLSREFREKAVSALTTIIARAAKLEE